MKASGLQFSFKILDFNLPHNKSKMYKTLDK